MEQTNTPESATPQAQPVENPLSKKEQRAADKAAKRAQKQAAREARKAQKQQRDERLRAADTASKQNGAKRMGFGKTMLAAAVGCLIAYFVINLISILLLFAVIGSLGSASEGTAVVKDGTFLKVDLSKAVNECAPGELESAFADTRILGLNDILAAIDGAMHDDRINGIYIYMGSTYNLSWGMTEELRNAIVDFHASDKPVLCYADSYSQAGYYLATACDEICLNPSGMVDFRGMGGEVMFYKDLLQKLDVHMQLVRPQNNAYKSAGETYTMDHMSEANREQIRAYISSIWDHVSANIAESRRIPLDSLNAIADNLSGCLAEDAFGCGLVDNLCFENTISEKMEKDYAGRYTIGATRYGRSCQASAKSGADRIAVIYAQGDVVPGTGNVFGTGVYSTDITKALDKAADDNSVKAIVLRINSPGGAVTASEIMTNAVIRAKQKKPVIVSMSDLAASAGYEISSNATKIVAQPTTITGSIGVFATIPEIGSMLKNKLGITTDTVMTHKNATGLTITRPLSPTAQAMMQRNVEDFYRTFCQRVADGRGLDVAFVDSIARGRVWTGTDALRLGLVDTLGGMADAIAIAASEAQVTDYAVVDYTGERDFRSQLMRLTDAEERAAIRQAAQRRSQAFNDPVEALYQELARFADADPMQARIPFVVLSY